MKKLHRQRESHTFPPYFDSESRLLILGSFPSVKSREQGFYYGHPQNRFWAMLGGVYLERTPISISEKKEFLSRHHIALYDVVEECAIENSEDASIEKVVPSDLSRIAAPITQIVLNGKKAGLLFERYQKEKTALPWAVLPSTSPANARDSLSRLIEAYRPYLIGRGRDD